MKNFTRMPNELLDLTEQGKLDCYDIAVYLAIFKHRNERTKKCYPGNRRLAKMLNISKDRLSKSIKNLERCTAIQYTKKVGVLSHYTSVLFEHGNRPATQGKTILKNKTINNLLNEDERVKNNKIALEAVKKKYNIKSCTDSSDS